METTKKKSKRKVTTKAPQVMGDSEAKKLAAENRKALRAIKNAEAKRKKEELATQKAVDAFANDLGELAKKHKVKMVTFYAMDKFGISGAITRDCKDYEVEGLLATRGYVRK